MRRFLLIIISLLSTIVSFADDYSIVFVHIGNTLPDYLKTAVGQAKLFNDDASIYVIGNEEALLKIADGDFAQDGISPHFINENCRIGSLGCCRITGTGCVGAIL